MSLILRIAKSLPDFEFDFDARTTRRLEKNLLQAGVALKPARYAGFSVVFSLFLSVFAFLLFLLLFGSSNLLVSFAVLLFCFSVFLTSFLNYPALLKKRRAEEIERDLPLVLRSAAVELQFNTPFEKILENSSSGYGVLGLEFKKVLADVKVGSSVQEALRHFAERVDSMAVKRSAMQLAFSYEHGFNPEGMRKLADELIGQQRLKSREFAAKQAFFGLLFIAISTIVPALFSAYVIIGSSFLALTFSQWDILLAFAFFFPLLDFALLYYLSESKPRVL
ncbi:MAG: type II secretion system F family protein [Candidatus Micrarchaeota archaeon]